MALVGTTEERNTDLSARASAAHDALDVKGQGFSIRRPSQLLNAFCLFFGDLLAFGIAVALGGLIAYAVDSYLLDIPYLAFEETYLLQQFVVLGCIALGLCAWFARGGHYTERRPYRIDLGEILGASIVGLLISGFIEFASKTSFSRLWMVGTWLLVAISLPLSRIAIRKVLHVYGRWMVNAVIIGKGSHCLTVNSCLSNNFYIGYRVSSDGGIAQSSIGAHLDFLVRKTNAGAVVLIPSDAEMQHLGEAIDALNIRMIPYTVVPPIDRLPLAGLSTLSFIKYDAVMLAVKAGLASPLSQATKRLFDVAVSCVLLIALLPIMLIVAAMVSMDGGPIFYFHERVGRGGKLFKCLKFRTMVPDADAALGELLANSSEASHEWRRTRKLRQDPRTTTSGRLLRATSIDELPQFINVLVGDMSLVGPRPVVQQELRDHYKKDNSYYLLVRPGITGLWQISGRTEIGYEQRVHLDAWYVRNWSLWGDIIILVRTLPAVIMGRGAC
jgi:Undecaprenyl-phosphate galactose phosphotransferase WbaP